MIRCIRLSASGNAPAVYAARALRVYVAMQRRFCRRDGLYRRDGLPRPPRAAAHLWPFARALVATLDLAGVAPALTPGFDADAAIAQRLAALERYWDPSGDAGAYSSDVLGTRLGGDRYYDDNAWVGLALIELERMRRGAGRLDRAAELFALAAAGWDRRQDVPSPEAVFWVEQGRGAGTRNHDRNTVSNAPNAELGLHLAELTGTSLDADGSIGAQDMYQWVNATLGADDPAGDPATGLFFEQASAATTPIDRALWSYNQDRMIGANVLLQRRPPGRRARTLSRPRRSDRAQSAGSLRGRLLERQPPPSMRSSFATCCYCTPPPATPSCATEILTAMRGYADRAWSRRRDHRDRFHFPNGGVTLLGQSAMVQVLALLAWIRASSGSPEAHSRRPRTANCGRFLPDRADRSPAE